jgi:hypothetical protein
MKSYLDKLLSAYSSEINWLNVYQRILYSVETANHSPARSENKSEADVPLMSANVKSPFCVAKDKVIADLSGNGSTAFAQQSGRTFYSRDSEEFKYLTKTAWIFRELRSIYDRN